MSLKVILLIIAVMASVLIDTTALKETFSRYNLNSYKNMNNINKDIDNTHTFTGRANTALYCVQQSSQDIMNIIEIDGFTKVTSNLDSTSLPSIIDFQKSKCKPCQRIAPDFEKLARKYKGVATFYKVDADSSPEAIKIMKEQGIRSVPTFQLWSKGSMVESIQGAHLDELESSLKSLLEKK